MATKNESDRWTFQLSVVEGSALSICTRMGCSTHVCDAPAASVHKYRKHLQGSHGSTFPALWDYGLEFTTYAVHTRTVSRIRGGATPRLSNMLMNSESRCEPLTTDRRLPGHQAILQFTRALNCASSSELYWTPTRLDCVRHHYSCAKQNEESLHRSHTIFLPPGKYQRLGCVFKVRGKR